MPKGAVDQIRALREARYEENLRRIKEETGKTVDRPKVIAKKSSKKKPSKIGRKRG